MLPVGIFWDVVALAGVALVVVGMWWICPPAALIALGLTAVGFALWASRYWK